MELGRVVAPDPLTEVAFADEAILDPLVVERDDTLHHVGQPLRIDDDQILQRSERIVKVHQAAHVLDTTRTQSVRALAGTVKRWKRARSYVEEGDHFVDGVRFDLAAQAQPYHVVPVDEPHVFLLVPLAHRERAGRQQHVLR